MHDLLLKVENLEAWYGESHVLHGVDFEIGRGELVTLLGRNGAGKTTTLRSIMGIVGRREGSIRFDSQETVGRTSDAIARLGIAYCPEERGIFSSLNVEENLLLPPVVKPGGMGIKEIYGLFPNLEERRRSQGTKLSGGEQQMLAIGRILRTGANLLLLDEPTEGLDGRTARDVLHRLALRAEGRALVIATHIRREAALADLIAVIEDGRISEVSRRGEAAFEKALDRLRPD